MWFWLTILYFPFFSWTNMVPTLIKTSQEPSGPLIRVFPSMHNKVLFFLILWANYPNNTKYIFKTKITRLSKLLNKTTKKIDFPKANICQVSRKLRLYHTIHHTWKKEADIANYWKFPPEPWLLPNYGILDALSLWKNQLSCESTSERNVICDE